MPRDRESLLRLTGSLLVQQNDEWLVSRRYLSVEPPARLYRVETIDADDVTLSIHRARKEVVPVA